MSEYQWLQELNVGDKVAVGSFGSTPSTGTVDKITATQIIVGPTRYSRKDGYQIGVKGYRRPHLMQLTEQLADQIRRERAVGYIQTYAGRTLLKADIATDLLEQIVTEMRKVKT